MTPHPLSWPPRLVDEAGVLEVSQLALRLLLRCQLPIGGVSLFRNNRSQDCLLRVEADTLHLTSVSDFAVWDDLTVFFLE